MADDMVFCQKCGTKIVVVNSTVIQETANTQNESENIVNKVYPMVTSKAPIMRKGMKISMIICFVLAGIYTLIGFVETMIIGFGFFFAVLGIMFLLLGKSPKGEKYIFGKLRKGAFIAICIATAYVFVIVSMLAFAPSTVTTSGNTNGENQGAFENNEKVSLDDIEKWYKNEMPNVTQNLIEYSNGVKGISNINITDSKFRFGEQYGLYDCHYTYYFTCKVNGEKCTGEARAFRKYNGSNVDWFHFEISKDSDWSTVVEIYDESFDEKIESYYKELLSQYK